MFHKLFITVFIVHWWFTWATDPYFRSHRRATLFDRLLLLCDAENMQISLTKFPLQHPSPLIRLSQSIQLCACSFSYHRFQLSDYARWYENMQMYQSVCKSACASEHYIQGSIIYDNFSDASALGTGSRASSTSQILKGFRQRITRDGNQQARESSRNEVGFLFGFFVYARLMRMWWWWCVLTTNLKHLHV